MGKQVITETAKSQVVNRVIIGNDMGGSLWATAIHNCRTNKDSYYGLKDRDGKRKEDRFYDLVREYLEQGFTVDVFYEAGRYGFSPARILMSLGAKVHILPINKLKVIMCGKVIKTDKLDAKFLSSLDPDSGLPEVYIPTVEEESRRDAERELVRLSVCINRTNAQILALIERTPLKYPRIHRTSGNWKKQIAEWSKDPVWNEQPPFLLLRLNNLIAELELFEKEADAWDQLIQQQEKKDENNSGKPGNTDKTHETVRKLKQFKAIGPDIARCLAWEVPDWGRFGNAKKFSAYFGMTPCPYSSGTINREQGISKAGRSSLRKKTIELGWLWVRWQGESHLVKKWKSRLDQKGRVRRMAIVAMTRQLLVALWRYVVKGEVIDGAIMNNPITEG